MLLLLASLSRAADADIPPDPARAADPWVAAWVDRVAAGTEREALASLGPAEQQRVAAAVRARGWLTDGHVPREAWRPWLAAALASDPDIRDRALRGVFYGARVAADGTLRVPDAEALTAWSEGRIELGVASFVGVLTQPALLCAPSAKLEATWAEGAPAAEGDRDVWVARIGGVPVTDGRRLARLLGLGTAACGERSVVVGACADALGGSPVPSPRYATVPERPDDCLDLEAVRRAAVEKDARLRARHGLADFLLTEDGAAASAGPARVPPDDAANEVSPSVFEEADE